MNEAIIKLIYLAAAVCFIFGLKRLSHPATARSGNTVAATGMFVAIVTTLFHQEILGFQWIIIGMIVGATIGLTFARTVKMTAMPEMVALLNGFGGAASASPRPSPARPVPPPQRSEGSVRAKRRRRVTKRKAPRRSRGTGGAAEQRKAPRRSRGAKKARRSQRS